MLAAASPGEAAASPYDCSCGAWKLPKNCSRTEPIKMTLVAAVHGCICVKGSASEPAPAPLTTYSLCQHDLVTGELHYPWPHDVVATLAVESLALDCLVAEEKAKPLVEEAEDWSGSTSYGTAKSPIDSSSEVLSSDFGLEAPEVSPIYNDGSVGHPDFCARPCLYFAFGTCSGGTECGFCHLAHDKYPLHLDKRNRLTLSRLSVAERMNLILPVLSERAQRLGLARSVENVAQLQLLVSQHPALLEPVQTTTTITRAERKKLAKIMKGLRVQDLISRLKPEETPPSIQLSIEILGSQMREEAIKEQTRDLS